MIIKINIRKYDTKYYNDGNIIFLAKPTGDEERRHASGSDPVESVW